ncbi:hypothetical protein AMATHDRAFT_6699 [Amanita thiersii Skay4041]|uniref:Ricin B lectin domain-containing protein n=1 Tax=Amanita thiersii Skay4041 TaxID=703135 RepID=A0A2A9NIF4_9AGAR|nr:hypothetical protein AMATHDRAFT_6699 [Amanita thiersii Skay4041]
MSLPNGTYLILNVRQNNTAMLPDRNDGTPVVSASPNPTDKKQQVRIPPSFPPTRAACQQRMTLTIFYGHKKQWILTQQGRYYTLQNFEQNNFANTGTRAQAGFPLEGRRPPQQFEIAETRVSGQFTVATTDTRLFLQLPDNQPGSPVILTDAATDQRSWWIFQRV